MNTSTNILSCKPNPITIPIVTKPRFFKSTSPNALLQELRMKIESAIAKTEINLTRKRIIRRLKNSIDQEFKQETQIKDEIE